MQLRIETEQEEDGRWLGEIVELPGVLVYGHTRSGAVARVQVLALRVLADRADHGEALPKSVDILPQVSSVAASVAGPL